MIVTIINDCNDRNAEGRQVARAASLFSCPVNFMSVSGKLDDTGCFEAAGNILDVFDAMEDREGVLLVNVAPRSGEAKKKWKNGTPFAYFQYKDTLVVLSIDGYTLSLVKKFGLIDHVNVMDIPKALDEMIKNGFVSKDLMENITNTQFRSYEFVPRAAKYIFDNKSINSEKFSIEEIDDMPKVVWWVDNFGNCKTSILKEEINVNADGFVDTKIGKLRFFERLKDVPNGEAGLVVGSSGISDKRFVEVVAQGKRADDHFGISVGTFIL